MSTILFETTILLLLILTNGLFAMSELAIVTARPSRLKEMAEAGTNGAQAALDLSASPNRFLSTVQVGITLIGILAGAFGGSTLARELSAAFSSVPAIAPYAQGLSIFLVVGAITFASVVLGELVPKRIALTNPERIATAVARPMTLLSTLATPVVRLLSRTTEGVLRLLGIQDNGESTVSEEEIRLLVRESAQAGIIEEMEQQIVERVFKFGDQTLQSLMTPRRAVIGLNINDSQKTNKRIVQESPHTRFPVYETDFDNIVGIARSKDLLAGCLSDDTFASPAVLRDPLYLPGTMNALQALERFKESGTDIGLVLDEFGGFDGIVTLIDILEALVGDIPTAAELSEPLIVPRSDGSFLVDGLMAIDEFQEAFNLREMPDEEIYQSLGGFVIHMLGTIPQTGDNFDWNNWNFEIVDMDNYRIDKILITPR
jgi:putative hemolysin